MKREAGGPCLSAVFVDYDNIYLSLKRKNEEAAKRFAKDAGTWIRAIESGRLITATNSPFDDSRRRIVMNRCYGNPVPRRNQNDNSTDMNSFPFVRHYFLRSGFEVIDCPPLTAQLKNSSDIRMVMDVRDYLTHDTYFDEFIILSGDADFTPLLHRLRAHARRTVIFANDFTAAPYTAISDGEIRESDLIALILSGILPADEAGNETPAVTTATMKADAIRREIIAEIVTGVRASATPVPLEALADRALRTLGHEKTIATGWAGAGSFRELLRQSLPEEIRLTNEAPYLAYDPKRHRDSDTPPAPLRVSREPAGELPSVRTHSHTAPPIASADLPIEFEEAHIPPPRGRPQRSQAAMAPAARAADAPAHGSRPALSQPAVRQPQDLERPDSSNAIQQSIARIHDACQAPPLAPPEYRVLFELMAKEINENDLVGSQTLANITQRAQDNGLNVSRDDIRFVLEVVSEADPWFEQGASPNLFAGRFRNFVVARCRGRGLNLSVAELDLIEEWFAGAPQPQLPGTRNGSQGHPPPPQAQPAAAAAQPEARGGRWWSLDDGRPHEEDAQRTAAPAMQIHEGEDFPRIVRTRLRG